MYDINEKNQNAVEYGSWDIKDNIVNQKLGYRKQLCDIQNSKWAITLRTH